MIAVAADAPFRFVVPGVPVPWSREFPGARGWTTDARTRAHKSKIALYARRAGARLFEGPVVLSCKFVFPTLKSAVRVRTPAPEMPMVGKPDLSNLIKCVEDALQSKRAKRRKPGTGRPGVCYHDDSQIVSYGRMARVRAAQLDPVGPRTEVEVSPLLEASS